MKLKFYWLLPKCTVKLSSRLVFDCSSSRSLSRSDVDSARTRCLKMKTRMFNTSRPQQFVPHVFVKYASARTCMKALTWRIECLRVRSSPTCDTLDVDFLVRHLTHLTICFHLTEFNQYTCLTVKCSVTNKSYSKNHVLMSIVRNVSFFL